MLFILNRSFDVINNISISGDISKITPYYNDYFARDLATGAETFSFDIEANIPQASDVVVGNYIAFKDEDEGFKLFTIIDTEENHSVENIKKVYCEMTSIELLNNQLRPTKYNNVTVDSFLESILANTDWTLGQKDIGLTEVKDIDITDYISVYEAIQNYVIGEFGAEIRYRVKIESNTIVGKYIDIFIRRGKESGVVFSYTTNMTNVSRTTNISDLVTALIGVGKNNITFRDIEIEGKPAGQDFIVSEEAYKRWSKNGEHIIGVEKFDTESPQELLKLTSKKLEERIEPKIKYSLKVELLGDKVSIGDTVKVVDHDFNPPLYLEARVSQLKTSKTDPTKDEVVLSNFKEIGTNITEEMKNIASKLEGYVDSQFPIGGDKIQNDAIGGNHISSGAIQGTHIIADSIEAGHISAESIESKHISAETIEGKHITAESIESKHIKSNSIEADHIQADAIDANHISANSIQSEHISSNIITANHIQTGTITAGSGIIADGAIGNAQISNVSANKIDTGEIDTSKVKVKGENGFLLIENNTLYVTDAQRQIRVELGLIENATNYGLIVRSSDGQTIMLDHEGVHNAGITDGAIDNRKVSENANISGKKLDIDSVIRTINENGTVTIEGTKIQVGNTTLDVELSKQTNLITEQGKQLETQKSEIQANTNAIKLKVDNQVYLEDKQNMTSKLEKNTSEISTMKGQIALKVEQTDIENAKDEINQSVDSKINSAKSEIKVTTDGISQQVGKLETTTTTLSDKVDTANNNATNAKNTANTANNNANQALTQITTTNNKLASIESNVNGITSRVSNVENKQTTVDGKVSSLETRMSTAESKITETAITNTVKKNFYTKSETDSQITSKGYQTASQVQQTVNGLQIKVQESGGYNLIYNGNFKKDLNNWNIAGDTSKVLISSTLSCSANQKGVRIEGTLKNAVWVHQSVPWDSNEPITLSYWQHTTANGSDGTTNPFRATQVVISYTDGTNSWHTNSGQSKYNTWEKISHTITPDSGKRVRSVQVDLWCRDTTKMVYYTNVMLEKGSLATEYTPNPNEIYAGITTIDKEGITVKQSNISTYTTMDASSFRVENNTGGTVAEFSQNSQIPNLTAGIINANEIYSPNICTKSPMSGSIKYIVNGSTGNDNNNGTTYSTPFKTVAKAVSMLNTQQDRSVDIEIYGSVTGFDVKGINGTGAIRFYFSDDAIVNGAVIIGGITNTIGFHGGSSDKPTFKNVISIYRCRDVEIGSLTFRGTNSNGNNIYLEDVTFARIISCDLGGLSTQLLCAIQARRSNLWIYNCRGSKITDVVAQSEFSIAYAPRAGTSNVPDYSNAFLCNYDGAGRIHNWSGGNFVKTPSKGWNPAYTPTQKTQTWSFNKIWSDETLNGWSDRQELIQGYSSTWNTGRWTGYMQMTDGMAAIRSAISGGTNLSGRIYVQRTSSSGNSTGSKLCLYASDGTLITNSTSINRSQGVWVSLSSSIIQKIQSGAITYFYLKADSNNKATYFKCESNAKIEITYTN